MAVEASGSAESAADLASTPGVASSRDPATQGYSFQQTMLRIRDPKRSLDFYTRVLGMTLIAKLPFNDMGFTLYFLAYLRGGGSTVADGAPDRIEQCFGRDAVLELTCNAADGEADSEFTAHSGNEEPKGFGHIGIEVPDVYAACERFEQLGVDFQKKPDGGSMKGELPLSISCAGSSFRMRRAADAAAPEYTCNGSLARLLTLQT
jgi:lactoylglutathione lyase